MTPMFRLAMWLGVCAAAPLCAQVTETPVTIQPGHFNARIDAITVGFNRDTTEKLKFTALGLASTIVSAGVTDSVDVQFGAQFFLRETYQYRGARESRSGLGRFSVRTKWTFWRDPAYGAAAAVIPYVSVPTNKNVVGSNSPEGGIIVPWAMDLGSGFRAGAMAEWDVLRNDDDTADHAPELLSSSSVNVVSLGDGFNRARDPEHLPATNAWQRFGNGLRKVSHFFGSEESMFGVRCACATMSIGIPAFLSNTREFFLEQRLVWAMIIVAVGMTTFMLVASFQAPSAHAVQAMFA